jgi:hypothetical protein
VTPFQRWSATAGLAFALIVTGATTAEAKPVPGGSDVGNTTTVARTSDGRPVNSEAVAKEVAAYWTPERMAAAVDITFSRSTDTTK